MLKTNAIYNIFSIKIQAMHRKRHRLLLLNNKQKLIYLKNRVVEETDDLLVTIRRNVPVLDYETGLKNSTLLVPKATVGHDYK